MADDTTGTQNSDQTATDQTDAAADTSLMSDMGADKGADDGSDQTADKSSDDAGKTDDAAKVDDADKSDADKTDAEKGDDKADDKASDDGLPEKYELKMPEGVELDTAVMEVADPVFRELGLGQEQAQKFVPLAVKVQERVLEEQTKRFEETAADWAKEAKKDPVLGGAKWQETEHLVAKAFDTAAAKMATIERDGEKIDGKAQVKEFKDLLAQTKLGNHPTLMRMFRFFGQAVGEDSDFIRADGGAAVKKSREEELYPNDVKK
jgi:hypothetical protein